MENPFDRPPINVSATLVDGRVPKWKRDYLATVSATTDDKGRLLDSLRTGEDPTIRDGVNLALSRLVDPEAPKDSLGKTAFLVHDGTGTGKSFQAILAAKAIALDTGEPALVTTRADLIPALRRDLDRLGLDDSQIAFVAIELKLITSEGGMIHREFPFYGNVQPAELLPLGAESRAAETQLIDGYARLLENRDFPQQRKLKEDLTIELNTASDATKVDSILQRTFELLSQNKKVILVGDDLPVASRILKEPDGLPKETPGFLSAIRFAMAAHGIECSFIRAFPQNSDAIPALSGERAAVAAGNFEEMARFVDGAYRTSETGQRLELRGRDNKPVYAPSQTKVILLPYQQVAGWPELNQRFPQAPEVSIILTPTANADQFIQAIGRGSRRNSQGPTDIHLVANDSCADRRRLSHLLKGLQFIAATGSPAIAPFLQLAADCLDRASTQRAAQDQRLIQLQKNQQSRSARIFDPNRYRMPSSQSGVRP
jgi:hypothetical protein